MGTKNSLHDQLRRWVRKCDGSQANYALSKVVKARGSRRKMTFIKPKGGFRFLRHSFVPKYLEYLKSRITDSFTVSDLVNGFKEVNHFGGNVYENKYWLTVFVNYARYWRDRKDPKITSYCVGSYLDPTVIDAEKLEIVGLDAFRDEAEVRDASINRVLSARVWDESTELSPAQLRRAVQSKFPGITKVSTLDRTYWTVGYKVFGEVLKDGSDVDEIVYTPERFDCDDFARGWASDMTRLGLTASGFVHDYSSSHAYNAVVLSKENGGFEAFLIEPQKALLLTSDNIGEGDYKVKSAEVQF